MAIAMCSGCGFRNPRAPSSGCRCSQELKQRGVRDILICCVDGLKGFPEAIEAIFPQATVQTCIVHYADVRVMPTAALQIVWWRADWACGGRHNHSASRKARSLSGGW